MINIISSSEHEVLSDILASRGMARLDKNVPFWRLKLSDTEYVGLKSTICRHTYNLYEYGDEAALCYAEWWRRDYNGNIPSKEDVAAGIGLSRSYGAELFDAARGSLKKHGFSFFHSLKGTEYFRTLLNQGGLPVNYIKTNDGNLGTFSRFLKGLVRELSVINYDWTEEDNSIIHQFNCISYLGKAFKNENIYDVAMQIAHAIIMDDKELLPYDDSDASLSELTRSLMREYSSVKREKRTKPLSLHWKLHITDDGQGLLFVNMDVVKDISSNSIPGINTSTCYSFDVFVAGVLVGKYVRKSINRDDEDNIVDATYSRISTGMSKDILWKGESVVEVKIRCDNDDRIFLTVAGCYPPNFDYPQVFQMLDDNIYSKGKTANAQNNIAIFNECWVGEGISSIVICGQTYGCVKFTESLSLMNAKTGEELNITNEISSYTAEFSGNYISWVEDSNFKLLASVPIIRVYDIDKNPVHNCKVQYRNRRDEDSRWHRLNSSCVFVPGLVDIRVEFPDGHSTIETFYAIGGMNFYSQNESALSTDITCSCSPLLRVELEVLENAEVQNVGTNTWRISRSRNAAVCPSTCSFRIFNPGSPILRLSVAIPFDGVLVTDVHGNIIPSGKIISFADLAHFCIISHGTSTRNIDVSYFSDYIEDPTSLKHLKSNIIEGLVSLSDYSDLITRMFNLYGANSFDRSSSVVLNIGGKRFFVRKFVLDSTIINNQIIVTDPIDEYADDFVYQGDLYAFPVDQKLDPQEFYAVKLERSEMDKNTFLFPEDYTHNEVVVFSGPEASRRIIPKYYDLLSSELNLSARRDHSKYVTELWSKMLDGQSVMTGSYWRMSSLAFGLCSQYNLPFTTYNGLKSIAKNPRLLAKFVLAMWVNEQKEVLSQDIDRFEQEMTVALHWVPAKVWLACVNEFLDSVPEPLKPMFYAKLTSLVEFLKDLFDATMSADVSSEFSNYIISGTIAKGKRIQNQDIVGYKQKIHGLSDLNEDLPIVKYWLNNTYYNCHSMIPYYRVMIESPMCAAENTCGVRGHINLFSYENKEYARVANFYRKYFKETYCEIFLRTVKLIEND